MTIYNFTISKECYTAKPDVKYITWKPIELDTKEMFNYVLSGYTITGDYGFKEEFLKGRTKDNWKSSPFLYIDLDDVDVDWDTLTSRTYSLNDTILRPTGVYTTFSHNIKGNRYRLVYVFDKPITDQFIFGNITGFYNNQISAIFSLGNGVDQCNRTVNQIMHGTNPTALKHYDGNIIRLDDVIGKASIKASEGKKETESKTKTTTSKKGKQMSKEEFKKLCRSLFDYDKDHAFKCYLYSNNWDKLGDSAKRKDILDVGVKSWENKETGEIKFYRFGDGTKRRTRLMTNARKIRAMNPNVTAEELKYNIVHYLTKGMIQNGNKITWEEIDRIVDIAMNEDYREYLKKREEYLGDKANDIIENPYTKEKRKYTHVRRKYTKDEITNAVLQENAEDGIRILGCSKATFYKLKEELLPKKKYYIGDLFSEGKKAKEIMEITGLKKSQVYDILKKLKEVGIEIAKVQINITNNVDQSFKDFSNNDIKISDNTVNFAESPTKGIKADEFINNMANRYKDIAKYFSSREAMNSFLRKYIFIPRTTPASARSKSSDISVKVTPITTDAK